MTWAKNIVQRNGVSSVAFPIISAGSGSCREAGTMTRMQEALAAIESPAQVRTARFRP